MQSVGGNFVDVPLSVRYAETDQMGHAYYANYLVWFEVARTTFCKVRGFSYADLEHETETFLPVVEAYCRYLRPLRYDDSFIVRTKVEELKKRTLTFSYEVRTERNGSLVAEGTTKHVFINSQGRPKSLPALYRKFLIPSPGPREQEDVD